MRDRRRTVFAIIAGMALVGCSDFPTKPRRSDLTVGVRLNVAASAVERSLRVTTAYARAASPSVLRPLDAFSVSIVVGDSVVPADINIAACLADAERELPAGLSSVQAGRTCVLHVSLALFDNAQQLIDREDLPPITARVGEDAPTATSVLGPRFSIGGTVFGLRGGTVGLTILEVPNSRVDVSTDGPFAFPRGLLDASPYSVRIAQAPANQRCTINASGGVVSGANVTNPFVTCGLEAMSIVAGGRHTCALSPQNAAYCWGDDSLGAVGDGGTTNRLLPTPVQGGLAFTALTLGQYHSCGLTTAGAAYCWGGNSFGQLGDGTTIRRSAPVPVQGGIVFRAISAGNVATCGLSTAGAAYCWGFNGAGGLGDGTTTSRSTPIAVGGAASFTAVWAGYDHVCGLTSTGAAYCWGDNSTGQIGDGTTTNRLTPVPVLGGLQFQALAPGLNHTCGFVASGAAHCWGANGSGQLGDGTTSQRLAPAAVQGGLVFSLLTAGAATTCGLAQGLAYCWGENGLRQLGLGGGPARLVPSVTGGPTNNPNTYTLLTTKGNHVCGRFPAGAAMCWGDNRYGQIGNGTTVTPGGNAQVLSP